MKRALSTITLQRARRIRSRGKAMQGISKKLGLLYFGTVDQRKDDHDVIRGLTASTSHKDRHYAVGTYDGYDISLADRYDTTGKGSDKQMHNWAIIQIPLHKAKQLPHVFIMPVYLADRFKHLFIGTRHMAPLEHFSEISFPPEFATRYTMYVSPQHTTHAEDWLTRGLSSGIAVRFWPHALECKDDKLIVYITEHRLTETVLGSALQSALWLADALDQQAD